MCVSGVKTSMAVIAATQSRSVLVLQMLLIMCIVVAAGAVYIHSANYRPVFAFHFSTFTESKAYVLFSPNYDFS